MSEKKDIVICRECGEKNDNMAKQCSKCGASLEEINAAGGSKKKSKKEKKEKIISSPEKRRNALVLLLVSLVLIILLFAPFANIRTDINDNTCVTVSYSPADLMKMGVNLVRDLVEGEQSVEYRSYIRMKAEAELLLMNQVLSIKQVSKLETFAERALEFYLLEINDDLKISIILALALCAVFAVSAAIAFVSSFSALCICKYESEKLTKKLASATKTVVFAVSLIPIFVIVFMHASHFSHDVALRNFGNGGVSIAYGAVLMLAVTAVILIQTAYMCFSKLAGRKRSKLRFTAITRGVAILALCIATISAFLPSFIVKFAAPSASGVKITSYSVSPSNMYELSYDDTEYYNNLSDNSSEEGYINQAVEIARGNGDSCDAFRAFHITMFWSNDPSGLYIFMAIVQFLMLISVSAVIRRMIRMETERRNVKKPGFWFFLSILTSLIYLGLSIAVPIIAYSGVSYDMSLYASVTIGPGPIIFAVSLLISVIVINLREPKVREPEYDDPDVSKAAYV